MTRVELKKLANDTIDKYHTGIALDHHQARADLFEVYKELKKFAEVNGWGYGIGDLVEDVDNLMTYHWQRDEAAELHIQSICAVYVTA